jgi:hypothetical protein
MVELVDLLSGLHWCVPTLTTLIGDPSSTIWYTLHYGRYSEIARSILCDVELLNCLSY